MIQTHIIQNHMKQDHIEMFEEIDINTIKTFVKTQMVMTLSIILTITIKILTSKIHINVISLLRDAIDLKKIGYLIRSSQNNLYQDF